MSVAWITVGGLFVATALIKAFGPVAFGGRELPSVVARVIPLLAPALLTALVITETFGTSSRHLVLDARAAGLAAAAVALWRRAPLTIVVLGAAAVTAAVRALS